jgi:multidrug efflux pump subunit AcrA (membrane-fusion protein)
MFEAEIDNRDGALQTGLFAEAEVIVDPQSQAIAVPPSSLIEFAGAEKVWKVVDGKAQEQIVQTARRGDLAVEVVEGLQSGDVILLTAAEGRIARVEPVAAEWSGQPFVLAPEFSAKPLEEPTAEPAPADPPVALPGAGSLGGE